MSQDHGCTEFDDSKILASKNEKPFKITSMVINYGVYIKSIQVTYLTSNGTFVTLTHGTLNKTTGWKTALLTFEADEWITKANVAGQVPMVGPPSVVTIEIETINSKGSVRSYGPWGQVDSPSTTVKRIIYGFTVALHPTMNSITLVSTSNCGNFGSTEAKDKCFAFS